MNNPFAGLKEPEIETKTVLTDEQRRQKRDAIYAQYDPLVNEVLDLLIAAYRPGLWKKGSDCAHLYCCHINWFAGPEEKYKASYDEHHEIRRHIEVGLEQDGLCNPVSFKVTNHGNFKCIHVGLTREELVRGIREVFE